MRQELYKHVNAARKGPVKLESNGVQTQNEPVVTVRETPQPAQYNTPTVFLETYSPSNPLIQAPYIPNNNMALGRNVKRHSHHMSVNQIPSIITMPSAPSPLATTTAFVSMHINMNPNQAHEPQDIVRTNPHPGSEKYKFILVTTIIIESIAVQLSILLQNLGHLTEIRYMLTDEDVRGPVTKFVKYVIIFNSRDDLKLPPEYILYQIEQSNYYSTPRQKEKQNMLLKNAAVIWDFSVKNLQSYSALVPSHKVFIFPMPFYSIPKKTVTRDPAYKYDVFFYGATNDRRVSIMNALSEKYNVKAGFGVSGDERDRYLQSCKVVVNLHYYEDSALETCRFNEILQFDCPIVSETAAQDDMNLYMYKDYVTYVDCVADDLSNIDVLYSAIDESLRNPQKREEIRRSKSRLAKTSEYFLKRNLLTIIPPVTSIQVDYDMVDDRRIYCLSLPETYTTRYAAFLKQAEYGQLGSIIEAYSAIKYAPSWKGCAYSYLNLMYNARRCGLKRLTVCEDDCCFPEGFRGTYDIVNEFLDILDPRSWDIFVGIVADLPEDTVIKEVYKYKGTTFLKINKMHSMVFNIYNEYCYNKILQYDINTDITKGCIDGFIKTNQFNIIIPVPFIVTCLNVDSSIWGSNLFDEYNKLFQNSRNTINRLLTNYDTNKVICSETYLSNDRVTPWRKTLVLFVFHLYNDRVQNFISNCIFKDDNIDFVVISNDKTCVFEVPEYVKVIKRDNIGYDFGGWSDALLQDNLYSNYDSFIFTNSSIVGPFLYNGFKGKWTDVYLGGLTDTVKLFGSTINCIDQPLTKSHVQSYIFSMDIETLEYLIECEIFSTTNYAKTFLDAVYNKEVLMSKKIIEKGWNFGSCMSYYRGVDFTFKTKSPREYDKPFLNDVMYDDYCNKVWTKPEVVFIKGNRITM